MGILFFIILYLLNREEKMGGKKVTKKTRKFQATKLKDKIKERKAYKKRNEMWKKRRGHKERKEGEDSENDSGSENEEQKWMNKEDEAISSVLKSVQPKKNKKSMKNMSVDEFLDGGFDKSESDDNDGEDYEDDEDEMIDD